MKQPFNVVIGAGYFIIKRYFVLCTPVAQVIHEFHQLIKHISFVFGGVDISAV